MTLIRPTREDDAILLPEIERSSGTLFRTVPDLAWIADDDVQSAEAHVEFLRTGLSLVSVDGHDRPRGFLCAAAADGDLHIWQLAVLEECQGRGLGRALMAAAIGHARANSRTAVTLTTFRDLKWNEHFYRTLGFSTLAADELDARLAQILANEAAHGLPAERRCAMRLTLA
ncbi:GNAT family N-acetyltransferase [Ensifer adhaerens]|uniref:GNAT family N-acetyltransferase n=1 Tax=Ensifer adhaerens TaxID=106592 RepID=UPI001CBAFB75|nr:GNAT family N-acetyltransferase [Ensifer adhaerens]MBZ7921949.1 GNAT family N-acetyltransferase [Ensifer adhaerens]UAX94344.1 GNAT family N-acetyltransferase [Ensifer adhaerens]UAY01979.1 GNAT family N-acetyltransferase [Ensifer adhaerens]UAY09362.1 GNAT family N-acetyltransferase [Ensifer adhaerens]